MERTDGDPGRTNTLFSWWGGKVSNKCHKFGNNLERFPFRKGTDI